MVRIVFLIMILTVCSPLPAQESIDIPYASDSMRVWMADGTDPLSGREIGSPAFNIMNDPVSGGAGKKSVGRSLLMSLIVPGSGEFYMGKRSQGLFFLGMEILTWGGLAGNQLYYNNLEDSYKTYAVQHAGVTREGKNHRFWSDIGKYDDIYAFNERRQRDRLFDDTYEVSPENYWSWQTRKHRLKYDGKRLRANDIEGRDVYFYTAILLNHLISGINAMRLARIHNRELQETSWQFNIDTYRFAGQSRYIGIQIQSKF